MNFVTATKVNRLSLNQGLVILRSIAKIVWGFSERILMYKKIPISCGEEIVRARIYSLCSGPQKQFIELIPRVFK